MLIYTRGSAVIEHGETSEVFEICEDELDWEPIGGHKRGMGPETIYQALIDHNELGELRWTMSEYPVGAEGPKTTDVGKHMKWSGKFGQRAKMYPTRMNGYENDEATELFRQV